MLTLELGGVALGLREAVIALIVIVALYIVFVLLRMRHLNARRDPVRRETPATVPEPVVKSAPAAGAVDEEIPVLREPEIPLPEPTRIDPAEARLAQAWEKAASGAADSVMQQSLGDELAQLRDEVDAMRGELAALRQDMQDELAHLRAAQTVSPIYGDAMQLALAGYDPAMIAERCGIARAEAELVVSLAKSQRP